MRQEGLGISPAGTAPRSLPARASSRYSPISMPMAFPAQATASGWPTSPASTSATASAIWPLSRMPVVDRWSSMPSPAASTHEGRSRHVGRTGQSAPCTGDPLHHSNGVASTPATCRETYGDGRFAGDHELSSRARSRCLGSYSEVDNTLGKSEV